MKICINGIIREMTAEEVTEYEKTAAEMLASEPTLEDQVAELKKSNAELRELLEKIIDQRR